MVEKQYSEATPKKYKACIFLGCMCWGLGLMTLVMSLAMPSMELAGNVASVGAWLFVGGMAVALYGKFKAWWNHG
jgi:hypothetical protein